MKTQELQIVLKNSLRNKLNNSDRRFHDWYRFVLSYPPHLVKQYIQEFNLTSTDLLLDPFCGTGTTIVEAKTLGIPSIGIEANPFAHFASSVKTNWTISPEQLLEVTYRIQKSVLKKLDEQGVPDEKGELIPNPLLLETLLPEQEKIILKNSISPIPLHKVLVLLKEIKRYRTSAIYNHLLLALGNSLVYTISNLKFGPEVGVGKIKTDVEVVASWVQQMELMAADLSPGHPHLATAANVVLSDARNLSKLLHGKQVSAVITSPPYPNEKDYTRTTRLESVVLGFINNKEELRGFKKSLLRSNTRGVYKGDNDDSFVSTNKHIQSIAAEIENRRIALGKTSGFERLYHKVAKLYFGGIAKHLSELSKHLKPGAQLAYVVGDQASYLQVMIRTGKIIGEIAESLGYELVRIDLFRTRFSTATKSDLNEEVVILRWNSKN